MLDKYTQSWRLPQSLIWIWGKISKYKYLQDCDDTSAASSDSDQDQDQDQDPWTDDSGVDSINSDPQLNISPAQRSGEPTVGPRPGQFSLTDLIYVRLWSGDSDDGEGWDREWCQELPPQQQTQWSGVEFCTQSSGSSQHFRSAIFTREIIIRSWLSSHQYLLSHHGLKRSPWNDICTIN